MLAWSSSYDKARCDPWCSPQSFSWSTSEGTWPQQLPAAVKTSFCRGNQGMGRGIHNKRFQSQAGQDGVRVWPLSVIWNKELQHSHFLWFKCNQLTFIEKHNGHDIHSLQWEISAEILNWKVLNSKMSTAFKAGHNSDLKFEISCILVPCFANRGKTLCIRLNSTGQMFGKRDFRKVL